MRFLFFFILVLSLNSCGFKPMYKLGGSGIDLNSLSLKFKDNVSYLIREELESIINNNSGDSDYTILVDVKEELVPIIINTNGTVSKYQIDIAIFFDVLNNMNKIILSDVSVGFAQFDVLISEIENENLKNQMTRSAINDASSLMITKIQSKLSTTNDN